MPSLIQRLRAALHAFRSPQALTPRLIPVNLSRVAPLGDPLQSSPYAVQQIADTLPDLMYIFDLDSRSNVYANRGIHSILGYSADQVQGLGSQLLPLLVHPDDSAFVLLNDPERIVREDSDGNVWESEYRTRHADGTWRWLRTRETVFARHADGSPRMILGIAQDITERRRAEEERHALLEREQQLRRLAEEANELKLKFLAMVSHELRTPLTSIKGFASTLLADDVTWGREQMQRFIQIIEDEADKLSDLVEQLLDVSRLQAGTLRIIPVPETVADIIDEARREIVALTVAHPYTQDVPAALPQVRADRTRIAQVIVNLVENAVKYSPAGAPIQLRVVRENGVVRIEVHDEGAGIAPENRDAIFEAFRQVERKNEHSKGAGLGLAICKGIVEAHGGRIWVVPDEAHGTTLTFTLPVIAAE